MWARMWGKKESLYGISGDVNWYSDCGKKYGGSSKTLKLTYHMTQQSHSCIYIPRKHNRHLKGYLHTYVHYSIIHNNQDMETT